VELATQSDAKPRTLEMLRTKAATDGGPPVVLADMLTVPTGLPAPDDVVPDELLALCNASEVIDTPGGNAAEMRSTNPT
jgi:hypothetical protein